MHPCTCKSLQQAAKVAVIVSNVPNLKSFKTQKKVLIMSEEQRDH